MSPSVRFLGQKIRTSIPGVTPGIQLLVYYKGKKVIFLEEGDTYDFYDWASLTKPVSTISLCMTLTDQKKLNTEQRISEVLKWLPLHNTLSEFMTHNAGLPWWTPLYKLLPKEDSEKKYALMDFLREQKTERWDRTVYSDMNFWILGSVVEQLFQQPLSTLFDVLGERLKLRDTRYHVNNQIPYSRNRYAPTEECEMRGRLIQGEVNDINAWALGGAAAHAGLFGPIEDLMTWALELRKALRGESKFWSLAVAKHYFKRKTGDWALGFSKPSQGVSSCGQYFSQDSIGHTGFTGTSIWFDPKKDLIVAILSNRIHLTRQNEEFKKLRPKLHDWVSDWIACSIK